VNKYRGYVFIQCVKGGEGDRIVWRAYKGVIHCVFDQIPNLQKPRRGGGSRQINTLPPGPFTGKFFRKADI
jgi:hypothetical protein